MANEFFENFLNELKLDNFNPAEEKAKILSNPKVTTLIQDLQLSQKQIDEGMNYLQKYFDYLNENNNNDPDWKLFVDENGFLAIDFTNDEYFVRRKLLENFWLTNITPLDNSWYEYFNMTKKHKPRELIINANMSLQKFLPALSSQIKLITSNQTIQGLYLVDENFIYARNIFKFLAFLMGVQKNKTVIFVDASALFQFLQTNLKNQYEMNNIQKYLTDVDCLFIDRFAMGTRPEWFINFLITVFTERELKQKPIFIASPIDFEDADQHLIINFKDKNNDGLNKLERLLKHTTSRICVKFIAKTNN
ncbi:hypothetical protein [Metamycoplasma neophronis]|uniref:Uncharacterized protein n=1 Tax=Metamycoplasma neophronis TaxID=872983 RepID=A0ABY2YZT2_9BACT|nr:hypothetical protein [Metamycoplasma neophronis]TPR53891.1 hypothetical protein FJR74_01870 [Metamycoplasma neophronis]